MDQNTIRICAFKLLIIFTFYRLHTSTGHLTLITSMISYIKSFLSTYTIFGKHQFRDLFPKSIQCTSFLIYVHTLDNWHIIYAKSQNQLLIFLNFFYQQIKELCFKFCIERLNIFAQIFYFLTYLKVCILKFIPDNWHRIYPQITKIKIHLFTSIHHVYFLFHLFNNCQNGFLYKHTNCPEFWSFLDFIIWSLQNERLRFDHVSLSSIITYQYF